MKPNVSFETPKSLEIVTHLFLTSLKTFTDKNTSDLMDVMGFTADLTDVLGFTADLTDVKGFTTGLTDLIIGLLGRLRPNQTSWTSSWSSLRFWTVPFVQSGTVPAVLWQILYCGAYPFPLFTVSLVPVSFVLVLFVPGLFVLVSLVPVPSRPGFPVSFFLFDRTTISFCLPHGLDGHHGPHWRLMDIWTSWTSSWSPFNVLSNNLVANLSKIGRPSSFYLSDSKRYFSRASQVVKAAASLT